MASIIDVLEELATKGWWKEWQNPAWKQYVVSGDEKLLKKLPKFKKHSWFSGEFLPALPGPGRIDEHGRRFLKACRAAEHPQIVGIWLQSCLDADASLPGEFDRACALLVELGCDREFVAQQVTEIVGPLCQQDGAVTPAGRFLLSLNEEELDILLRGIARSGHAVELAGLYLANAPERWRKLMDACNRKGDSKQLNPEVWVAALNSAAPAFLEPAARAFELSERWPDRFEIGSKLYQLDPARFGPAMERLVKDQLLGKDTDAERDLWQQAQFAATWLVNHRGKAAEDDLKKYFSAALTGSDWHRKGQSDYKKEVLDAAVQRLGRDALPLLEACFETDQPEVQLRALQLWSGVMKPADTANLGGKLRQAFASSDASFVARAVRISVDLAPETFEDALWPLLAHKSRPVRDAAANTLARLGESRLSKAGELWLARRADTRLAAVAWLKAVGTPPAADVLRARLDDEEDDDVRDAILLALEKLQGGSRAADPAELRQRIKKALAKIDGPPVAWLDVKSLPLPKLNTGSKLPADSLLYLLHRQSRVKDMRADIEARPLYEQIDRKTSGDLALAVLKGFFGTKVDADDRWAMGFAAIIGDDRLVPVFSRQIKEWADNMRGRLAEYAVQALALLGTDAALLAVDAMAIRYRSKNKNIGKAATEAFAAAAAARGLTVEELGDLVVPWLGFAPGQPRLIETGKATFEARIGNDFKLNFRDAATNKKVAKLPDSAPAAVKSEFKEIAASLKEAVKSQLLRMETLMVRQFRWPAPRWRELYLQHPLLLPFAQRLVWGAYSPSGQLTGTFRALEDRSLTDAGDEAFAIADNCSVGVVHPLELSPEARQAWLKSLADYDIVPPFAQMERPVVIVKQPEAATKFGNAVAETELNGLTFKGRAERLGWARGSVCDAGCINYYLKSFPAAGVDAFVETEGMYVGIDMYTDIKLGRNFFVKHGSVQIGSYVYDEPGDPQDPRLASYGEVPVIAFSEAMGDLAKIAGKGKVETTEGADV